MAISTPDASDSSAEQSVCDRCGRPIEKLPYKSILENGLRILVVAVLALVLTPLAVLAWKLCSNILADRVTHLVINLPPEDWTQY